jgi:arylsulfatase A-like enzyme
VPTKNLICIVVDRLHAGMIGSYGNSWIHTSQLDRLTSESFLFDQAYFHRGQIERFCEACWLGVPAHAPVTASATSLPRLLGAAGIATTLMTDDERVARHRLAADFTQCIFVEPAASEVPAVDELDTGIGRLFATAADWLQSAAEPFCLWLHVRGMDAPWDAPLPLRNQFAGEEDPEPSTFTAVPDLWLPEEYDPDQLLGLTHAYAGQVSLLDAAAGLFLDQFRESKLAECTQLTLLSPRGFALGEHGRVGPCEEQLANEISQLVWWVRFPDGAGRLARSQALVQPADLPGTLADWLELDRARLAGGNASSLMPIVRGECDALRDRVFLTSLNRRAIRTPAWLLCQGDDGNGELYAKPGDRWEVNEVSALCPEVVDGLQAILAAWDPSQPPAPLAPLAAELVTELD